VCKQHLACSRRAVEEHAFWGLDANMLEELWAEEGKFNDLRRWAVSVPGVRCGQVRWNGWATPIASVLCMVLQSWEGEDGCASVSKRGGRWESAVQ
jgi:hypothetical protein